MKHASNSSSRSPSTLFLLPAFSFICRALASAKEELREDASDGQLLEQLSQTLQAGDEVCGSHCCIHLSSKFLSSINSPTFPHSLYECRLRQSQRSS